MFQFLTKNMTYDMVIIGETKDNNSLLRKVRKSHENFVSDEPDVNLGINASVL